MHPESHHAQASSPSAATITRCDDDIVTLALTAATVLSGLDKTEERLTRLIAIGFGTIEVNIDVDSATNPEVTSMLSRMTSLLADADSRLTIRTSPTKRIG